MNTESFSSAKELSDFLEEHGVDIEQYGKQLPNGKVAKEIGDLLKEIQEGESTLQLDEETGELIRKKRILVITVLYKNLKLSEEKQVFKDTNGSETRKVRKRSFEASVGEKMKPNELPHDAIMRAMREELGILLDISQIPTEIHQTMQARKESPSYPGILNENIEFTVDVILSDAQYNPEGYMESQPDKNTYFNWEKRAR